MKIVRPAGEGRKLIIKIKIKLAFFNVF